jgi:hypothetical protein
MPIDQISAFNPYFYLLITYGAIVIIVPKTVPRISESLGINLANPRSTILYTPLCDIILSVFKSR